MSGGILVALVALLGSLFLGWRRMQASGLSLERKAQFAVIWAIIIIVLAFVAGRMA